MNTCASLRSYADPPRFRRDPALRNNATPPSFPRGNTYRRMTVGCPKAAAGRPCPVPLPVFVRRANGAARRGGGATEASDTARRSQFTAAQNDFVRWNVARLATAAYGSSFRGAGRARGSLCATRGPEGRLLPSLLRTASADTFSPDPDRPLIAASLYPPFPVLRRIVPSCPHDESSRLGRAGGDGGSGGGGGEEGREKGLGDTGQSGGRVGEPRNERGEEPRRGDRVEGE